MRAALFLVVPLFVALAHPVPVRAQTRARAAMVGYRDGDHDVRAERTGPGRLRLHYADGRTVQAGVGEEALLRRDANTDLRALELVEVRSLMPAQGLVLVRSTRAGEDGLDVAARLSTVADVVPDLRLARRRATIAVPPNDPRFQGQWYLEKIDITRVWRRVTGDANTVVVVVDDGCDVTHPDLAAHLEPGADLVDGDEDPSFAPGQPGNGHGTACAGIVAAVGDNGEGIAGTCPECHLRCVRLLPGDDSEVPISADVAAFQRALVWDADVVSNSWGFVEPIPAPGPLAAAVREVIENGRHGLGALVIFAAGNESREIQNDELQGVEGVITVGATNRFDEAAPFSNTGRPVDLVAPTGTLTTDPQGSEGEDPGDYTNLFGGTSAACPVVAGVAALLASAAPEATGAEIASALVEHTRPAPFASSQTGHDTLYGYGILDPEAALTALLGPVGEADAGSAPGEVAASTQDEGCGCHVPGRRAPIPWALWLACAALWLRRANR